jgi:hypothetical protein
MRPRLLVVAFTVLRLAVTYTVLARLHARFVESQQAFHVPVAAYIVVFGRKVANECSL